MTAKPFPVDDQNNENSSYSTPPAVSFKAKEPVGSPNERYVNNPAGGQGYAGECCSIKIQEASN